MLKSIFYCLLFLSASVARAELESEAESYGRIKFPGGNVSAGARTGRILAKIAGYQRSRIPDQMVALLAPKIAVGINDPPQPATRVHRGTETADCTQSLREALPAPRALADLMNFVSVNHPAQIRAIENVESREGLDLLMRWAKGFNHAPEWARRLASPMLKPSPPWFAKYQSVEAWEAAGPSDRAYYVVMLLTNTATFLGQVTYGPVGDVPGPVLDVEPFVGETTESLFNDADLESLRRLTVTLRDPEFWGRALPVLEEYFPFILKRHAKFWKGSGDFSLLLFSNDLESTRRELLEKTSTRNFLDNVSQQFANTPVP